MNRDFDRRCSAATAGLCLALGSLGACGALASLPAAAADAGYSPPPSAHTQTVIIEAQEQSPLSIVEPFTTMSTISSEDIARTPGADLTNSLAMITDFVPGAYIVHDQLHLRGGHQVTWAVDGVEIPNTAIGSNLGPQINPLDIARLEVERGAYGAGQGDRTYGIFNVVPRTGLELDNEGHLVASAGTFGMTNDFLGLGGHSGRFAYYGSVNGNRSGLGIEPPVARIIHDSQDGYGAFTTLVLDATPADQLRFVGSARRDDYQIPLFPGQTADDVQHEADAFGILSWVRTLGGGEARTIAPRGTVTTALFYHYNRADLDGAPGDLPISTSDQRTSNYVGGQESVRFEAGRNVLEAGLYGFAQWDEQRFAVIFNDEGHSPVRQIASPSGTLLAAYLQDTFRASRWLTLSAGVRQTHFSGAVTENATSPRLGATVQLPGLGWELRSFYGEYYQAPPLDTLSGPLLAYATASNLAFLPLHGERDREWQVGLFIPARGWSIDIDYFHTRARNFFDHNPLGDSNIFLPLTIDGALVRGTELTLRSPRLWDLAQGHLAWSNQTADGFGAVSGGLTDFSPPGGAFALDHDQRNTVNAGLDVVLPQRAFVSLNLYYGSGFANGSAPPSHLPGHTSLDLSVGKAFGARFTASLTVLNVADRRLLIDESETFGGTHFDDPREVYAEIHYRFGY